MCSFFTKALLAALLMSTMSAKAADLTGYWKGKIHESGLTMNGSAMFRYDCELSLLRTSDSTTYVGILRTDRGMHQDHAFAQPVRLVIETVVSAKVTGDKVRIEEKNFIRGQHPVGLNLETYTVVFSLDKKGVPQMERVKTKTRKDGMVVELASRELPESEAKLMGDLFAPKITISDPVFTADGGGNALRYMGRGSIAFTITNGGTYNSPEMKFSFDLTGGAPLKIEEVIGPLDKGIPPGGKMDCRVLISATDRILEPTVSMGIGLTYKGSGRNVVDPKRVNIPVQQD